MLAEIERPGVTASNILAQGKWVAEVSREEGRGESSGRGPHRAVGC